MNDSEVFSIPPIRFGRQYTLLRFLLHLVAFGFIVAIMTATIDIPASGAAPLSSALEAATLLAHDTRSAHAKVDTGGQGSFSEDVSAGHAHDAPALGATCLASRPRVPSCRPGLRANGTVPQAGPVFERPPRLVA